MIAEPDRSFKEEAEVECESKRDCLISEGNKCYQRKMNRKHQTAVGEGKDVEWEERLKMKNRAFQILFVDFINK